MKTIKEFSVTFCLFLIPVFAMAQKKVVVNGIEYEIIGDNAVEVARQRKFYATNVVIPSSVTIEGKEYTVEAIGEWAFGSTNFDIKIKEISLPITIKIIRECAFYGALLTQIKLPMGLERIEESAFSRCSSLRYVYFPPSLVSLGSMCFSGCNSLVRQDGYHKDIVRAADPEDWLDKNKFENSTIGLQVESAEYKATFSYNYAHRIYKSMQEWQKKKSFETPDQWRTRMTTQTRERKMRQFVSQFKEEFAREQGSKATPAFSLGLYDDDYNVYSLESKYGVAYVAVPASEKENFRRNFNASGVSPTYCVKDDKLAVASVIVKQGGKIYRSPSASSDGGDSGLLAMELPPLEFRLKDDGASESVKRQVTYDRSLDSNIPVSDTKSANTFVVAIGNENYQLVPGVAFAENDINTFSQYCQKTLGVPMQNIRKYKDASFGVILSALKDLKDIADAYSGELNVIFYYAGHGIPGDADRGAYLLPADADGKQTEVCFPVSRLYKELGGLDAKSVVVFMDACFSGSQRGEGMLASARGVAIKPKEDKAQGNMVVFSAATGAETAYPYGEKGHGMFTYFLLKKLQESTGNCTLGELSEYITTNVKRQSVVVNRKSQTPTVVTSDNVGTGWKNMKLK